jgi:hypothetical protein
MPTYEVIKEAILNRQCITCNYNGYRRLMTPHVIGRKNGTRQALCYQYAGESSSGLSSDPAKNWRCIVIDNVNDVFINDDAFQTAHNHSSAQTCVDDIDVEVDY